MEGSQDTKNAFPEFCSAPWLTFFHGKPKQVSQTFYSLSKRQSYDKSIPELRDSKCWATSLGWMLIHDLRSAQWFLLNPRSMAKIELPQLEWDLCSNICDCFLSSPPTDPDCTILCIDFKNSSLFFCRPGGDAWVRHVYDLGEDNLFNAVACKGKFYFLTRRRSFLTFDVTPRPGLRILEQGQGIRDPVNLNAHGAHLVESFGQIFLVHSYHVGRSFKVMYLAVFQMNFSAMSWDMVESLGDDRVFMLGIRDLAVSYSARELGVKRDCIYFVKPQDTCMYVFDMEEGTIVAHLPCPNVKESYSVPLWIVPTS